MTAGQSSAVCSLSCSLLYNCTAQPHCTTHSPRCSLTRVLCMHVLRTKSTTWQRVNRRHHIPQHTASEPSRAIPACRRQSLPASRTAQASRPLSPEGTTRHAVSASPLAAQTMRRPPAACTSSCGFDAHASALPAAGSAAASAPQHMQLTGCLALCNPGHARTASMPVGSPSPSPHAAASHTHAHAHVGRSTEPQRRALRSASRPASLLGGQPAHHFKRHAANSYRVIRVIRVIRVVGFIEFIRVGLVRRRLALRDAIAALSRRGSGRVDECREARLPREAVCQPGRPGHRRCMHRFRVRVCAAQHARHYVDPGRTLGTLTAVTATHAARDASSCPAGALPVGHLTHGRRCARTVARCQHYPALKHCDIVTRLLTIQSITPWCLHDLSWKLEGTCSGSPRLSRAPRAPAKLGSSLESPMAQPALATTVALATCTATWPGAAAPAAAAACGAAAPAPMPPGAHGGDGGGGGERRTPTVRYSSSTQSPAPGLPPLSPQGGGGARSCRRRPKLRAAAPRSSQRARVPQREARAELLRHGLPCSRTLGPADACWRGVARAVRKRHQGVLGRDGSAAPTEGAPVPERVRRRRQRQLLHGARPERPQVLAQHLGARGA